MTEIYDKKLNHLLWRFHAFILDIELPQAMNYLTLLGQTIAAHTTHQHCTRPVNETDLTMKAVRNLAANRTHCSTSQCCILIQLKLKIANFTIRITWDKPSEDTTGYSWVPVSLFMYINGARTGEKGFGLVFFTVCYYIKKIYYFSMVWPWQDHILIYF